MSLFRDRSLFQSDATLGNDIEAQNPHRQCLEVREGLLKPKPSHTLASVKNLALASGALAANHPDRRKYEEHFKSLR